MGWRLGLDIGGTFTDLVLIGEHGAIHQAKTLSSRVNPSECIRPGIEWLAKDLGISARDLLGRCDLIIHGTTVAINALITHRGAKVGLMCTKGFRDSVEIRLAYKEKRYDHAYQPPPVLVPRYLRLPVEERVDKLGNERTPLNEDDVRRNVEVFKREGVEAVAVCFLWSFLNPAHERRAGEIIREEFPVAYVSLSVDVLPQIREYDRTSTTVVNAYVGPVLARYIDDIEKTFRSLGYQGEIRYMQSNAGIASGDIVKKRGVLVLNSGPAAGPTAGLSFSRIFGKENIITTDMGGTSFDTCLVTRGLPDIVTGIDIQRYRIGVPMINVGTIGAGGGSIAQIDMGLLRVGPESAEAEPGPACYGRGGTEPTVTDANVVLGYFPPEGLLGGDFKIDGRAARMAIEEKIAKPLGIDVGRAALVIFNLVNRNMADAIHEISLERGYDPRDYTLVVAGGCGPAHAGRLAKEIGMSSVLIPKMASTFCAFGAVVADVRHDYGRSCISRLTELDLDRVNQMLDDMEREGFADLELEGVSRFDVTVLRNFEMRYLNQVFECTVPIPLGKLTQDSIPPIVDSFHRKHAEVYAYSDPKEACELVGLAVTMLGRTPKTEFVKQEEVGPDAAEAKKGERLALFEEYRDYISCPVYDGGKLRAGNVVDGPAVIEEVNTTIVVFPGSSVKLDSFGVYVLTFEPTP